VRNRRDGSVETVVEGSPDKVEEFLALATKGPKTVLIEKFHVVEAEAATLAEFATLAKDHDPNGFFSAPWSG
jgi:acylphosphatase